MPRTHTATERSAISNNDVQHLLFLEVANADGTLIDCSNLGSAHLDFADGAAWSESLDTMIQTGTLTIWRDTNTDSAAPPINATSTINRNALGAYAPLFEKGRAVRVRTATLITGQVLTEADKKVMFLGRIDTVHWHQSPMTVDMSDLGAWLVDANIPATKQYADKTGVPGAGPLLGAMIQSMIDDAIPPAGSVPLYQPVAATWQPYSSTPENPGSLFQAIYQWAQDIGWNIGYKFDAADNYRLTLYAPNRTNNVADWVIGPSEYTVVSNLSTAIADIRNKITVDYIDGSGAAQSVTVTDAASITKYGGPNAIPRLWRFSSSTIRNATDATALANAVLSDLAAAPVDLEIQLPYFWPIQIDDMCTIQADGDHFDVDQLLAVVSYQHELKDGHGTTTIRLRGKVAGAYSSWIQKASTVTEPTPALPPTAVITADTAGASDTSINVTFNGAPGVGATALQWQYSQDGGAFTSLSTAALPQTVAITRQAKAEKIIVLKVVQDDGQTVSVSYVVAGRMIPLDRTTGTIDRSIPWHDGFYGLSASDTGGVTARSTVGDSRGSLLNGMFRYSIDSSDGVVDGSGSPMTGGRRAYGGFTNLSGGLVATSIDSRGSPINGMFRYGTDSSDGIVDGSGSPITGGRRAYGGFSNSTGALVGTAVDARGSTISNMFRYGIDGAAGIIESVSQSFIHPAYLDGSRRPVSFRAPSTAVDFGADVVYTAQQRANAALNGFNRLVTAVDETAVIGQESAGSLSKRAGIFFSEVFNQIPGGTNWGVTGGGTRALVTDTSANGPRAGKNLLQSVGYSWFQWQNAPFAFNQSKLYRIRARVRCTVDGDGLCYMGFQQLLADGSTANPNGGNAYCVFAGDHLTVAQGWVERTVWVKGASVANTNTTIPPSFDPLNPSPLNTGTVQLNPIIAVGYPSGTGTFQIDYFQVEEMDEDASARTYNALQGGGNMGYLQPGVVDARGSQVQTHFRYGSDTAVGIVVTTTRQFYDPTSGASYAGGVDIATGQYYKVGGINRFGGDPSATYLRSAGGTLVLTLNGTQLVVGPNATGPLSNALGSFIAAGNDIEFGHANPAGYRSTIGSETSSGRPFIAFHAEAGTNANTYRTRGLGACLWISDLSSGCFWGNLPSANADNQGVTKLAALDSSGTFQANAFSVLGVAVLANNSGGTGYYNVIYDGSSRQALWLGGTSDPTTYHRNNVHNFQNQTGSASWQWINSAGIWGNLPIYALVSLIARGPVTTDQVSLNFIGGSTDTHFRNAANNADNLVIADGGAATFRGYVQSNNAFILSGFTVLGSSAGLYTMLFRQDGNIGMYLGSGGDPANYYDSATHYFRSVAGGTQYGLWNAAGLSVYGAFSASSNISLTTLGTGFVDARGRRCAAIHIDSNAPLSSDLAEDGTLWIQI